MPEMPLDWRFIRLLIQGEAPGENEVNEDCPFTGKAGWWIRRNILFNAGIRETEVVFDNTLRCLPPINKQGDAYPMGGEKDRAERHCRQYDQWTRAPLSIPLMLVGGKALAVGLGKDGISEWHGHMESVGGRLVGCTFHPSAVMRNPNYLPVVIREVSNLVNAARNPAVLERPRVVKGRYAYCSGDLVTDLEWNGDTLTVVGIAQSDHTAFSSFDVAEGIDLVRAHIEAGERIIGHNLITADLPRIGVKPLSWGPKHVIDTFVVAHLIHCHLAELGLLDLGSMVRFYDPTIDWKHDKKDLLLYNGYDCAYNWRLWKHLETELTVTEQWHLVEKQQKLAALSYEMHQRGIRLDSVPLVKYARQQVEDRLVQARMFPFNPNAPAQIVAWAKSKHIYIPNAQYDTIAKLQGQDAEFDRLIEYRTDIKGITTWFPVVINKKTKQVEGLKSEYIFPQFHVTGTDVARFSCSEPNCQNIPPHLRRFIIPRDPDLELAAFDGSQIENRTVAYIADDKAMLAAFASGVDFHRLNARNIQSMLQCRELTLEEVTKDQRQEGKTVTHATDYVETVYNLARRLFGNVRRESLQKAQALQDAFFRAYPMVRRWHHDLAAQFDHGDVLLRNPFGRVRFVYAQDSHEFAKRAAHFLGCSTAADVVNQRALWVWDQLQLIPILIVHDELVYELPKGDAGAKLRAQIKEICDLPTPEMGGYIIPFVASRGGNYGKRIVRKDGTIENPNGLVELK